MIGRQCLLSTVVVENDDGHGGYVVRGSAGGNSRGCNVRSYSSSVLSLWSDR